MSEVRLIDANALKAKIQALIENDNAEDFEKGYNIALQGVIEKIDNAPTIDCIVNTIEVRSYGEWKYLKNGYYECSECKYVPHEIKSNFCPNCGADMRGNKK